MYAGVVFPLPFRKEFTYIVPGHLKDEIQPGVRVAAPFGKRSLTGYVITLSQTTDVKEELKPIEDVLDTAPIFDEPKLGFFRWMSEYYMCSLGEALRNSVPYGSDIESRRKVVVNKEKTLELLANEKKESTRKEVLSILADKDSYKISTLQKRVNKNIYSVLNTLEKHGALAVINEIEDPKVRIKTQKYVRPALPLEEIYEFIPEIEDKAPKQVAVLLELLASKEKDLPQSRLLEKVNASASSIDGLRDKGLVEVYDKEVDRTYTEMYDEKIKKITLTERQREAVDKVFTSIEKDEFRVFLVHGVTGSGKTQVYIELTTNVISKGKTAIILVPEISLTPQITSRFFNHFGEDVAVLHSRMSLGERYDTWRKLARGDYKIVIGPRSALFAPIKNIGLIVVDEEHDASYKQFENTPRYHARDSAVMLAYHYNCPAVLGSATPSVESKYNADQGKYTLIPLPERIDNAKMPEINLVDVNIEQKKHRMENIFSKTLLEKIGERLRKKEGVIILQNRRGFATNVYCEDCGEIVMCENCSVSMVHHINKNILQCHYCGHIKKVPKACTTCGSTALKFFGTGTQRVEDELEYYFPNIKMERVDSDSVNQKGKLSLILNSFRKGEIEVLVGTQMVSKGLDFSHVTLVGVVSAETTLWLPDFRADERTFQLLTQVSGRSGRSDKPGEVIIQTQNKTHFVLQKVLENDYPGFYEREVKLRKAKDYPPFTRLCLIEVKDLKESNARGAVNELYNILFHHGKGLNISAPAPAVIERLKGYYRFQLLIKSYRDADPSGKHLRQVLHESLAEFNQKSRYRNLRLTIDIDPQSIL